MALLASTLPAGTKYATPQELLSLFAENLSVPVSDASVFVLSTTAPNDQSKIWLDSSTTNPTLKVYNGGWVSIGSANNLTSGLSVTGGNVRFLTPALSIDSAGSYMGLVGIGTELPTAKLDVVGTIKSSVSVTTPALLHPSGSLGIIPITGGISTTSNISMSSGSLTITAGGISASGNISTSGGTLSATAINVGTGAITGGSLTLGTTASISSAGLLTAANITTTGLLKVGSIEMPTATTATTSVSAGGAAALPATPAGYLQVTINGTIRKIPFYPNT